MSKHLELLANTRPPTLGFVVAWSSFSGGCASAAADPQIADTFEGAATDHNANGTSPSAPSPGVGLSTRAGASCGDPNGLARLVGVYEAPSGPLNAIAMTKGGACYGDVGGSSQPSRANFGATDTELCIGATNPPASGIPWLGNYDYTLTTTSLTLTKDGSTFTFAPQISSCRKTLGSALMATADDGLSTVRGLDDAGAPLFGFPSAAEASRAVLGEPVQRYDLETLELNAYDPLNDPALLLDPMSSARFSLFSGGRTGMIVARESGPVG